MLVPEALDCQYHVVPPGGVPRVSTVPSQLFVTEGGDGVPTWAFTVTFTLGVYFVLPQETAFLRYHLEAVSPPGGLYVVDVAPLMLVHPLLPLFEYCHW